MQVNNRSQAVRNNVLGRPLTTAAVILCILLALLSFGSLLADDGITEDPSNAAEQNGVSDPPIDLSADNGPDDSASEGSTRPRDRQIADGGLTDLNVDEPSRSPDGGGPDIFGYTFRDSNDPVGPTYAWEEIASTGTLVTNWTSTDDGYAGPILIGFPIDYYGNFYDELYIGSNGYVSFGQGYGSIPGGTLPNSSHPHNDIALFGGDMYLYNNGGDSRVYYQTLSNPTRLVLEFVDLYYCCSNITPHTFEVILYPDGDILVQYQALNGTSTTYVGIENEDSSDGLSYGEPLADNLAIAYYYPTGVFLNPSEQMSYGQPGESVNYTVWLTNLTGATDSFELSALPGNNWNATLSLTQTGSLADGDTIPVEITVDIPALATPGDEDDVFIHTTSVLSPTVYSNTATITTKATGDELAYVAVADHDYVALVDTSAAVVVGTIDLAPEGCDFPWRVAIPPDGETVWVSCRYSNSVVVIDRTSNQVSANITNVPSPADIGFTQNGDYAFVGSRYNYQITVIDTATYFYSSITTPGYTPGIAVHPHLPLAYATNLSDNMLSVLDTMSLTVIDEIDIGTRSKFALMSYDGLRLYTTNPNDYSVSVIDTLSNSEIAHIDSLGGPPVDLTLSLDGDYLFVNLRNNNVAIIDTDTLTVQTTIQVDPSGNFDHPWGATTSCTSGDVLITNSRDSNNPTGKQVAIVDFSGIPATTLISMPDTNGDGYPDQGARGIAVCPQYASSGVFLSPPQQTNAGALEEVVSHQETLYNATGAPDTFMLTLGSHAWETALSESVIGPVADGESVAFTINVTVPVGVDWYDTDMAQVTATSATSPTVYSSTAVLTTEAFAPPSMSVTPGVISRTLLADEMDTQTLAISNGNGITGTFRIVTRTAALDYAVVGYNSSYMQILLSEDPSMSDYTFTSIGNNWTYESINSFDGIIVDECNYCLTLTESAALRQFFDDGRPVILGMDDVDDQEPQIQTDVYYIFGVNNAQDGYYYVGSLNMSHPIAQGVNLVELYHGNNDHFVEDGAVWVVQGNDGNYYVLAHEGQSRSVIFGENLSGWWNSGNQQLVRNAIIWSGIGSEPQPWLEIDPLSGIVQTNSNQVISFTFNAEAMQPDIYSARTQIQMNDPGISQIQIPVTMTVLPSVNMGWIEGTITDSRTGSPLEATVIALGQPYTIHSDAETGYYKLWVDEGSYTLQAAATGYVTETVLADIVAQQGTIQDFELVLNVPVVDVTPRSLAVIQEVGDVATQIFTITNNGPAPLNFDLGHDRGYSFAAVSRELYGYMVPQAHLEIYGTEDDTHVEIIDLSDGSLVAVLPDLDRYETLSAYPGPDTYYKIESNKPVVAYEGDSETYSALHNAFVPSLETGPVGKEFIFLHLRQRSLPSYVFAIDDATVDFYDSLGNLATSVTISAGEYHELRLTNEQVYHAISTGRISIEVAGNDGYTTVPSSNGDALGNLFYFVTDRSNGAMAVFAYEETDIDVFDMDSGSLLYSQHIALGDYWWQTGVGTRRLRLESTGKVEVWAGSTEGGSQIEYLGDDISFAGGRNSREFYLHSLIDGSVIFAPHDNTRVNVDGVIYDLNKDDYLHLTGCCFFRHILSNKPILIQTLGADSTWNNMGTYLGGLVESGTDWPMWLSADPITGTVPAFSEIPIQVTFDATGMQPGSYEATINVGSNDPFAPTVDVTATMDVLPTADMGHVAGTVFDDWSGIPMNATIELVGVYSMTASPEFDIWAPAGTYTLMAYTSGYYTKTMAITITAGVVTVQDCYLEPALPRLGSLPSSIEATIQTGHGTVQTLIISNTGPMPLEVTFHEISPTIELPSRAPVDLNGKMILVDRAHNEPPLFDYMDLLNDLTAAGAQVDENFVYPVTSAVLEGYDILWVNCCGYTDWAYDELTTLRGWLDQGGAILVHGGNSDATIDVADIYDISYQGSACVQGTTTNVFDHPISQGVSAVYLSYDGCNSLALGNANSVIVVTDEQVGEPRVVAHEEGNGKMVVNSSGNFTDFYINNDDNHLLAMNTFSWLANPGYVDILWLWTDPETGVVPGHDSLEVMVHFDAANLPVGIYEAILAIEHDDPNLSSPVQIPVTFVVTEAIWETYLPFLVGYSS